MWADSSSISQELTRKLSSQLIIGTEVSISGTLNNGIVIATTVVIVTVEPDDEPPTDGLLLNTFVVRYVERTFDGNTTTFTYTVTGTNVPPDLSHFDIEIPICAPPLQVVATRPDQSGRTWH